MDLTEFLAHVRSPNLPALSGVHRVFWDREREAPAAWLRSREQEAGLRRRSKLKGEGKQQQQQQQQRQPQRSFPTTSSAAADRPVLPSPPITPPQARERAMARVLAAAAAARSAVAAATATAKTTGGGVWFERRQELVARGEFPVFPRFPPPPSMEP